MERIACVDLPAVPLQLLLQRHPSWRGKAVAVVQSDRPQGLVLATNRHAQQQGITAGMSFAAAQSLAADLHAATVSPEELQAAIADLHLLLCDFSPRVEVPDAQRGVFFLDPSGLTSLYGSLEHWSAQVVERLAERHFSASIVVGFQRFRCHALARSRPPQSAWVVPDPQTEARMAERVPLIRLDLSPDLRDALHVLGIRTLGELLRIPQAELRTRFGEEAWSLHRAATNAFAPLQPRQLVDPIIETMEMEPPDGDYMRLLFGLKALLHRALAQLVARGQALQALHLHLKLDHAPAHDERIEPAAPTLDALILLDLVRLRLEGLDLPAAVTDVTVELEGVRADPQQLALFRTHQRRDPDAASRALARLRALFGPECVTRARLRAAHLPEAGFEWEPTSTIDFPHPRPLPDDTPCLVRRVFKPPILLPPRPRHEPATWIEGKGAITRMHGPFRISGGWWVRLVERDYYYAETQLGEVLWLYYDRPRRQWYLQGIVD